MGRATFGGATFGDDADFGFATFGADADFGDATFGDDADFTGATFGDDAVFGPLFASGTLLLNRATLAGRVAIWAWRIAASGADLSRVRSIKVRWAQVDLAGAALPAAPLTISAASLPRGDQLTEDRDFAFRQARDPSLSLYDPRPRITSLVGVDAQALALSDINLAACDFSECHNLDRIRLEGVTDFARAPAWFGLRMMRGRQALRGEHEWRVPRGQYRGWLPPAPTWATSADGGSSRAAKLLEVQYRALRKAREDAKDEPGAADFYYGEMEMRRFAAPLWSVDHIVLAAYWLLSGYGLRAGRAALAFLTAVIAFAAALWAFGFAGSRPAFGTAVLQSAESATSLLRGPGTTGPALTAAGEGLALVLRLLGPVLLGLAVFSLRGRIKR